MKTLRIHALASWEAAEEAAYYESKRQGWGRRFLAQLNATYDSIIEYPAAPTPIDGTPYRKLRVRGFPNAVIYRVLEAEIRVMAVANLYREPGYWTGRRFSDENE